MVCEKKKNYKKLATILILTIALLVAIFFIDPVKIVDFVGIKNAYLISFLIASLGGLSIFTSSSFFVMVATFSIGGVNPLLLGFFSGIGLTIGDSLFFFVGYKGRPFIESCLKSWFDRFVEWFQGRSSLQVGIFVYLYASFSPFPNDILAVFLASAGYPYRKFLPLILVGNITLVIIVATFFH